MTPAAARTAADTIRPGAGICAICVTSDPRAVITTGTPSRRPSHAAATPSGYR